MNKSLKKAMLTAQRNEITEYHIYSRLAAMIRDSTNAEVLRRIAKDELRHYEFCKEQTGQDVRPSKKKIFFYTWIARLLGLTFAIRLMESGEAEAEDNYLLLGDEVEGAKNIADEEDEHENELIGMLDEERLQYVGSMVLGMNDALVELTGALAGFTYALQNTDLIALVGLITGIAASFSMAASEYLSTKSEKSSQSPAKAALYTGFAYIATVIVLILPYLLLEHPLACLGLTLSAAVIIILFFNYYISVAQNQPFWKRFLEMAGISLGVAALSFGIGIVLRLAFGIEV